MKESNPGSLTPKNIPSTWNLRRREMLINIQLDIIDNCRVVSGMNEANSRNPSQRDLTTFEKLSNLSCRDLTTLAFREFRFAPFPKQVLVSGMSIAVSRNRLHCVR
jgi:hypothetical protein